VTPRLAATAVSLACAALLAATFVLWALGAGPTGTSGWGTGGIGVILLLLPIAFTAVGAVIALRLPGNAIAWVCLGIGFFLLLGTFAGAYGSYGGADFFNWLDSWTWLPAIGTVGTFLLLLFPDGRLPSRRWRAVAFGSAAVIALATVSEAFQPGALANVPEVDNPYGIEAVQYLPGRLAGGANVLLAPCFIAAAASLVMRFRGARGRARLQIKWFASAAALLAVLFATAAAANVVAGLLDAGQPLALRLLEDAVSVSAVGLPIAIGIAVLRHDLYEIDVIINRTLVYGALTASLATAYITLVLVFQVALSPVTSQSDLAVAVSTLVVAALARPARGRIQALVDRRFYRRKYDAERTLERFGERLRHELDPDAVRTELRSVVSETMQPSHVSLWVRAP
jgi:hypothetical protein